MIFNITNHTRGDDDLKSEHKHDCASVIAEVKPLLPKDEELYDLAEVFKVFGDSTRIKILFCLFEHEMCVNDIAELTGATQSAVSHQLRILKNAKLVSASRDGKQMIYSLSDEHVRSIIGQGMEHINE